MWANGRIRIWKIPSYLAYLPYLKNKAFSFELSRKESALTLTHGLLQKQKQSRSEAGLYPAVPAPLSNQVSLTTTRSEVRPAAYGY